MKSVIIYDNSTVNLLDIVRQVKADGLELGVDFDFHFHMPNSIKNSIPKNILFKFYKEEYSTYFALRFQ
jgi:hypothetical protein